MPVIGCDSHLPAIEPARLSIDHLRRCLSGSAVHGVPIHGDGGPLSGAMVVRPPAAAAVLVGLVPREQGLAVLLTRRTEHLKHHAGQISFPGGRREPEDADDAATALREAREEVGLDPRGVEVIGQMPVYTTVTQFAVTPVVGLLHVDHVLSPDASEVAEAFEVPLAFLMDPARHQRHRFRSGEVEREFLSMPWQAADGRSYFIWGATAAMLRNLYHVLSEGPFA